MGMTEAERDGDAAAGSSRSGSEPASDPPASAPDSEGVSPAASVDVQSYIGVQLRAVYDDVAKQPIPDRFLELMRRLD
jgi:hypothetical protein